MPDRDDVFEADELPLAESEAHIEVTPLEVSSFDTLHIVVLLVDCGDDIETAEAVENVDGVDISVTVPENEGSREEVTDKDSTAL